MHGQKNIKLWNFTVVRAQRTQKNSFVTGATFGTQCVKTYIYVSLR